MQATEELLITDADIPASTVPPTPVPAAMSVDPAVAIENKVAPRVAEASLMKVVDQISLNAVAERLAINKALQKEAFGVFKPIKDKMNAAKQEVLDQEKRVMEPLQQEEKILKLVSDTFLAEQERIERARQERERVAREAEERRLLAEAETARVAAEKEINERLQREHEEEVERQVAAAEANLETGSWPENVAEEVAAIIATPAPERVSIPLDIPVMPVAAPRQEPAIVIPVGMARRKTFKAEVVNITLLCRAIAEGKVPASYVDANMTKLNQRVRADEGKIDIPGVRAVEDSSISSRAR